jgi:hypothetical protein
MRTGIESSRRVSTTAAGGEVETTTGDVDVTINHAEAGACVRDANASPYPTTGTWARARIGAVVVAAALGLAGCESSGSLLGVGPSPTTTQVTPATPPPQATIAKVAIAPVIGAPDGVAKQLQGDFGAAVAQQRVSVVSAGDKADYTLRGYIVAAKDRAGTKVSYIWDVTDPAGKRLNRITGEEVLPASDSKDPWQAVTPPVMQTIAQKSAQSFGAWVATANSQGAIATAPPAAPAQPQSPSALQTASTAPAAAAGATASARPAAPPVAQPVSANAAEVTTVVSPVAGAPGDGATSLTQALQAELTRSGVPVSNQTAANGYRVEGVVKMGQTRDGKQPIQIDWNVKDPQGKRLGTVTQKNEIPEGSLDGAWGKTADAAAAAAAQGIVKLLPQRQ